MGCDETVEKGDGRTAFRQAEKQYKLYSESRHKGGKRVMQKVDLGEVLDFNVVAENSAYAEIRGVERVEGARPTYTLHSHPGFYMIPGALSPSEQQYWIQQALQVFPEPPNRTNHDAEFGPIEGLWESAEREEKNGKTSSSGRGATEAKQTSEPCGEAVAADATREAHESTDSQSKQRPSALKLLRKLRWATLGLQYDWSTRSYNESLPHAPFPPDLACLAARLATPAMTDLADSLNERSSLEVTASVRKNPKSNAVGGLPKSRPSSCNQAISEKHSGYRDRDKQNGGGSDNEANQRFQAEGAIVNYYGPSNALSGHLDDVEANMNLPIVSISLGCKAVFLIGGETRDVPPTATFLRSGDVVLMAGPARRCYHGVPRIFTDPINSDLPPDLQPAAASPSFQPFAEYIATSRININVRQVH